MPISTITPSYRLIVLDKSKDLPLCREADIVGKMKSSRQQISQVVWVHSHRLTIEAAVMLEVRKLPCRQMLDCSASCPIQRQYFVREAEIHAKNRQKPIEV